MYHRGTVGMGSMGSAKPINFQRRVPNPSIFDEIQYKFIILTQMDTKIGYFSSLIKVLNPSIEIPGYALVLEPKKQF